MRLVLLALFPPLTASCVDYGDYARRRPEPVRDGAIEASDERLLDDGARQDRDDAPVDRNAEARPSADAVPPFGVKFDRASDLDFFDFVLSEPRNATPVWTWEPGGDFAHLVQTVNAGGEGPVPRGALAIYRSVELTDVAFSVQLWTTDDDYSGGLVFRHVSETEGYRFAISPSTLEIQRFDGDSHTTLACAGACAPPFSTSPLPLGREHPGVVMYVGTMGDSFIAYINDNEVPILSAMDATYRAGRVGVFARYLSDAHFENFTIYAARPANDDG